MTESERDPYRARAFAPVATFLALDATLDAVAGLDEGQVAHREGPGAAWIVRDMA